MKGRPELDSCSEEGDPVQTFLQIRQIVFINLDVNYLHKFKRTVYNFIWLEKVLVIQQNFVGKAELQELSLRENLDKNVAEV